MKTSSARCLSALVLAHQFSKLVILEFQLETNLQTVPLTF